jgi:hypothetical protein
MAKTSSFVKHAFIGTTVRPLGVDEGARLKIEAAGAIVCSRGVIKIIDLESVKALSCECYETLRGQTSVS